MSEQLSRACSTFTLSPAPVSNAMVRSASQSSMGWRQTVASRTTSLDESESKGRRPFLRFMRRSNDSPLLSPRRTASRNSPTRSLERSPDYLAERRSERVAAWKRLQREIPEEIVCKDEGALFYVPNEPQFIQTVDDTHNYYQIRAATKGKLVERVTSLVPAFMEDYSSFLNIFFMTYRSYMRPMELLQLIIRRYDGPDECHDDPETWPVPLSDIRRGVCFALSRWFSDHYRDFSATPMLKKKLDQFISHAQAQKTSRAPDMVDYIAKVIREKAELGSYQSFYDMVVDPSVCPAPILPKSSSPTFLDLDELEIARQLTIEEYHIYAEIKPEELQDLAWSKPRLKHRAPNVLRMIERINHISSACVTLILQEPRVKARKRVVEKLLRVMEHLYAMNSFSMLRTILSAFEQSPIYRLKWTFSLLKPKYVESAKKFETLFSSEGSHKNLRSALEHVEPPAIPFLGVYLTDLTLVDEGNLEFVDGNLVNFTKKQLEYNIIVQVLRYQQTSFQFHLVPSITSIIGSLPTCSEKELYDISLEVEPRGVTSKKELK